MTVTLQRMCLAAVATALAACSAAGPPSAGPEAPAVSPTAGPAVRTDPVVPGRRARVFVMAGFGKACEPLPAPVVTVDQQPAKGDVSFVPGQETTLSSAGVGACAGRKVTGTGIYYTARTGETGTDTFSVTAKLAGSEVSARVFQVTIAE